MSDRTGHGNPLTRIALRSGVPVAVWIVVIAIVPSTIGQYYVGLGSTVGINALLALGLALVTGYAGQFSLAQAAFFGIGAYTSALLTVKQGWPALAAIIVAAAGCAALAYLIGKPIFRLRGHFLAMGTLALTAIVELLFTNLTFTGGSSGFGGIEPFSIGGFRFQTLSSQFWLTWGVVGVVLWGSLRLGRGREGRALRALRGHEAAAASCGVNISWSKTKVFAGSAFIGSIAGSLYAHEILYVNPRPFSIVTSIDILTIIVLGGLRSPWGAVIGAICMQAIKQGVDQVLPGLFGASSVGAGEALVLGLILVLILVLRPTGIVGAIKDATALVVEKLRAAVRSGPRVPGTGEAGEVSRHTPGSTEAEAAEPAAPVGVDIVLEARGLDKRFGGVHAVHAVNLTLHDKEILAVIGPNGAGKTTLLNLLSGNLPPTSGHVLVKGKDVTSSAAHRVAAAGLARTFQTPSLFAGMDVRENVLVGSYLRGKVGLLRSSVPTIGALAEERRLGAKVDEILRDLGMADLAHQEATQLSLGQQKMCEVARALAHEPDVLLLDEPGAGLNRVEKLMLADTLRQLRAGGMGLLLIEHDMEFVMSLADRVQVLNFGSTLRVGSPADVQADEAVISAYLGVASQNGTGDAGAAGSAGHEEAANASS